MKKIASGKTKDVFEKDNGHLVLFFKDDVTGDEKGIDPGANTVKTSIAGKGRMSFELTRYFFGLLESKGIRTHLVSADEERSAMEVRKARLLGKNGLEFIWRSVACGSFYRRYRTLLREEFQDLPDAVVEITLKDDEGGDPPITADSLAALNVLTLEEARELIGLTKTAAEHINADLRERGLRLLDMKLEFGDIGGFQVIDEASADSMRVAEGGRVLSHEELYNAVLAG